MIEFVNQTLGQYRIEALQLNPGMQQTVNLSVNVARTARNHAGDYPVTIRARSREKPNEAGIVQAHWTVLPFKEDAVDIKPRRASSRGSASYTVILYTCSYSFVFSGRHHRRNV